MWFLACTPNPPAPPEKVADSPADTAIPAERTFWVQVDLEGVPAADVLLTQPGTLRQQRTDANGLAAFPVDFTVPGEHWIMAAYPEAYIQGLQIQPDDPERLSLSLARYATADNPAYVFQHPGLTDWNQTNTGYCSHCHQDLFEQWYASPHRSSASNPLLWSLFLGTSAASQAECTGVWSTVDLPGGGQGEGCLLGDGVQGAGDCADCHAPGIDGVLGGRDLREAKEDAFNYGIHCDVCHKVDSVDLSAPAGVAGRLKLTRPSVPGSRLFGGWQPITFAPFPDVVNPKMGSVYRPEFHEAAICGGCHELEQATATDRTRWPEGRLPIHSTYSEWSNSALAPDISCQSCHMPPDPTATNSQYIPNEDPKGDTITGWFRPPGSVHTHSFVGPRQEQLLDLAASLSIFSSVEGGVLTTKVTTKNVGPPHAIPTGEPLRQLVLTVEARCGAQKLTPVGGTVVPDWGGYAERREAGEDWERWPDASVGDHLRVIRLGEPLEYSGFGPFGDGRFTGAAKGMTAEFFVGEVEILSVDGGKIGTDAPVPAGDVVYRVRDPEALAGTPGFGFARVLVGADGSRMVPHHQAVDVASDNRLLWQQSWESSHSFASPCSDPVVTATLRHRDRPYALAVARQLPLTDRLMVQEVR